LAFERVAALGEIPEGRGLCVRLHGREIGVYRVGDALHAMDNVCPHAGYPLHEGELEDRVLYCAGHGWPFDVTTGRPPDVPGGAALARYAIRVVGDEVQIDLDSELP
jgi:nitrite reductase/ring-hydroxylating ferredoxin subunit